MYGRAQLWSDTAVPDTLGIWYMTPNSTTFHQDHVR